MNKLEQILEETKFSKEEYAIYKKVAKEFYAEDLQYYLNEKLEDEEIDKDTYDKIVDNADLIIEKYVDYLEYDWQDAMRDAIEYFDFK